MISYNKFYYDICKNGLNHPDWADNAEFLTNLILEYNLLNDDSENLLSRFSSPHFKEQYNFLLNLTIDNVKEGLPKTSMMMSALSALVLSADRELSFEQKLKGNTLKTVYNEMIFDLVLSCKDNKDMIPFICGHILREKSYLFKKAFKVFKSHPEKHLIKTAFEDYIKKTSDSYKGELHESHFRSVRDFLRSGFFKDDEREFFLIKFFRNYHSDNFKYKSDISLSTVELCDFYKLDKANFKKVLIDSWEMVYCQYHILGRGINGLPHNVLPTLEVMLKDVNFLLDNYTLSEEESDIWTNRFSSLQKAHDNDSNKEEVGVNVAQISLKLKVSPLENTRMRVKV